MNLFRRILTGATIVTLFVAAANADTINAVCGTAGPGATELGPTGFTTTDGTVGCTGFNTSLGTLTSITLTLSGAVLNQPGYVSAVTVTNSNAFSQSGTDTAVTDFTIDVGGALPGFTLPSNPDLIFGGTDLFEVFASTGAQTIAGGTTQTFNMSGSGNSGGLTNTNMATFGTYESAYNFVFDTKTNLAEGIGGGSDATTQATFVSATAAVTYTYTPDSSTPEPTTMVLFGSGLIGLGLLRKCSRRA
jgi:hypothetical protein